MKNSFHLFFAAVACLLFISCTQKKKVEENFTKQASQYLNEFKSVCEKDSGKLWGKSLCVPMIILNRETNEAVATQQAPSKLFKRLKDGNFSGIHKGPKMYANTSFQWETETWSMVLWPLGENKNDRADLMIHEAWHSIQNDLNLPGNNIFQDHLDQYDGRLLIRLEWQALLKALESPQNHKKHIETALRFRATRFSKFKNAQKNEKAMDFHEGLAAYTGAQLRSRMLEEKLQFLKEKLKNVTKIPSIARSSSYYSGPLYGLLLDTYSKNWKSKIPKSKGLGELLKQYLKRKIGPFNKDEVHLAGKPYDFKSINEYEKQRAKEKGQKISTYLAGFKKSRRLKIQPNPGSPTMFDPRGILVVGPNDYIYTSYETSDKWGRLMVTDGIRVKRQNNKTLLFLSPPIKIDKQTITGNGWTLDLKPGWTLKKFKTGKAKPSFEYKIHKI